MGDLERVEMEIDAKRTSKFLQAIACPPKGLHVMAGSSDSNRRRVRRVGPFGDGLHQRRPLHPLHCVEIYYVN